MCDLTHRPMHIASDCLSILPLDEGYLVRRADGVYRTTCEGEIRVCGAVTGMGTSPSKTRFIVVDDENGLRVVAGDKIHTLVPEEGEGEVEALQISFDGDDCITLVTTTEGRTIDIATGAVKARWPLPPKTHMMIACTETLCALAVEWIHVLRRDGTVVVSHPTPAGSIGVTITSKGLIIHVKGEMTYVTPETTVTHAIPDILQHYSTRGNVFLASTDKPSMVGIDVDTGKTLYEVDMPAPSMAYLMDDGFCCVVDGVGMHVKAHF